MSMFEPFIHGYTLMDSTKFCWTVLGIYVLLIFFGPTFMKERTPLKLKQVLMVYNCVQIFLNAVLFYKILLLIRFVEGFSCFPPLHPNDLYVTSALDAHYFYFLLKILDFADTLFMVLRKKNGQISLLHVYHHISTFCVAWYSGVYYPGGYAFLVGIWNTLVHTIMYGYYLVTSLNRDNQKPVSWKKYVTLLQLVQHLYIFLSVSVSLLNPNCTYSKKFLCVAVVNMAILIYFFTKFYITNYVLCKKSAKICN